MILSNRMECIFIISFAYFFKIQKKYGPRFGILDFDARPSASTSRMTSRQNGRTEATLSIGRRDVQRHSAGGGIQRCFSIAMHHLYLLSIKSSVSFIPKNTRILALVVVVVVICEWIFLWEYVGVPKKRDDSHKSSQFRIKI